MHRFRTGLCAAALLGLAFPVEAKVSTTWLGAVFQSPASFTMPAWTKSKADPAFGGTITGMTQTAPCTLHYQSIQEVDPTGAKVLWDKGCTPPLISDMVGNVVNGSLISGERRWDYSAGHAGYLYAFRTTGIYRSNATGDGSGTLVCPTPSGYTFPTTSWPWGGTADVSDDGTVTAVTPKRNSDGQPVMQVWNLTTCARTPDVPLEADWNPGYAEISHGGQYVFVYKGCATGAKFPACDYGKVYDASSGDLLQDWSGGYHEPGHADWVIDVGGQEYVVGPAKAGAFSGHIIRRHPTTGAETDLTQGKKTVASHVSGRGSTIRPGWAVATMAVDPTNANTSAYAHPWGECLAFAINGAGAIERIVQTHTAKVNSDTEARCTSRDGVKVFFDSNGGGSSSATNHGYLGQ